LKEGKEEDRQRLRGRANARSQNSTQQPFGVQNSCKNRNSKQKPNLITPTKLKHRGSDLLVNATHAKKSLEKKIRRARNGVRAYKSPISIKNRAKSSTVWVDLAGMKHTDCLNLKF